MSDGVVGALIGAAVTLLVAGIGALVAVYQITKQAGMGLKGELYREVLAAIASQGDAERDLSTKLGVLSSLIALWLRQEEFGGNRPNPSTSWAELHDLNIKAQTQGAELMCLVEKWLIVDPRLDMFKLAFGSALHDMTQAWAPLSNALGAVVPAMPGAPFPPEANDHTLQRVQAAIHCFRMHSLSWALGLRTFN